MIDYDSILAHLQKTETCVTLSVEEASQLKYDFIKDSVVWKITSEISYKSKNLEIIFYVNFPNAFPLVLPKIFIDKELYESLKYIPHVNKDASICIFDEGLNLKEPQDISEFMEVIIAKAKKIIRDSENGDYLKKEFKSEFKAYWEIQYSDDDKINNLGFHSISNKDAVDLKAIRFVNKLVSNYEYYVFEEVGEVKKIKKYCDNLGVTYTDVAVLLLDEVIDKPPYDISFHESMELIKKDVSKYEIFKRLLKEYDFENIIIAFKIEANSIEEYYGWSYKGLKLLPRKKGGLRNNSSRLDYLKDSRIGKGKVCRITFDNLTLSRLQMRTSSYLEKENSVVISGLGSVGSNLLFFLKNLSVTKFNLVDVDILSMDNIKRHFSGFGYIGKAKTKILEHELKVASPLYDIEIRNDSIVKIIDREPNFINNCDIHIVAVGKSTVEKYILKNMSSGKLIKPAIFFWVEPFLASGQMLVINQTDASRAIEIINNYSFNVLREDQIEKTYLVEGSCQTGYFPYSSSYLIMFLSAIYPVLSGYFRDGVHESKIFTWIGDKSLLEEKKLLLSDFGNANDSFKIICNDL